MNSRLDELLGHAKQCASIGMPELAEDHLRRAIAYGQSIGVRVPHTVRGEIIAQARRIESEIDSELKEFAIYYAKRR